MELENKEQYSERERYLKEFERQNHPAKSFFGEMVNPVGESIVELLKKEDLTHDQAYASLQYAYNLIRYESNFLKLN